MSLSRKLKPFRAASPQPKPSCAACGAFAPECMVPFDDDTMQPMCWQCAHQVVDHGQRMTDAPSRTCKCKLEAIYPEAVVLRRRENARDTKTA